MGYERIQKEILPVEPGGSTDFFDLSASAATILTWIPSMKCKVYGWGGMVTEVVAASGFNTTAPVVSLEYTVAGGSGVEKSTLTYALNTGFAVGTEKVDYFSPFVCDGELGDALVFKVKTQGAGQTATGEVRPFLLVEWFPACTGE